MVFNLKGLMSEIRPTQIGIGALERINQKFRDDEKLDAARAQVVTAEAAALYSEAEENINNINKRKDRFNTIAETYSPEVADYMGQQGIFAMFDDVADLKANPELDIRAKEIRNDMLTNPKMYTASENPYLADTEAALISKINDMKASLNSSNNIPENTYAIAAQIKLFDEQLKKIQGKKSAIAEQGAVFSPKVPTQQFDLSVADDIKDRIILDNIQTAQFLRVNFFDEKQMANIGLPVVSQADAGRLFGIGNPVPNVREIRDIYKEEIARDSIEMSEKDVIKKYTARYQEDFYKSVQELVQAPLGVLSNVRPEGADPETPTQLEATVASFLPDRKFAIRQNYINQVRRANPGLTEEAAINALLNDPEVGYIFKLL
jgi:hypothetical protein